MIGETIGQLPDTQREVIRLRDVEGWSAGEVVEALEISDGQPARPAPPARSRVRAALETYLDPGGAGMSKILDDITCRELVELVSAYLDGTLGRSDLERFEAHLEICDDCRTYVEQMGAVPEVSGRLDPDAIEPEIRNRLMETFRDWTRRRGEPDRRRCNNGAPGRLRIDGGARVHRPADHRRDRLHLPVRARARPGLALPSVVLEIVAGIVVGPSGLGWVEVDQTVEVVAVLGLAFLLFLAGLEIEFDRLRGRLLRWQPAATRSRSRSRWSSRFGLKGAGLVETPLLVAIILCATSLGVIIPVLKDAGRDGQQVRAARPRGGIDRRLRRRSSCCRCSSPARVASARP